MNTSIDHPIFLARQQEQRKLPKILACGIGGSLVFHGIAAIAFNYLPQHSPIPVEVTLIDPSEIPAELKPSPSPTITPLPKVKPTPTPSVKAKPAPTPVIKITPIPTPSVKVKPDPAPTTIAKATPTPSVKVKPEPTPQIVKIVTKPVVPVIPTQKTPKKLDFNDLSQQQNLASAPFQKNRDRQLSVDPVTQPNRKRSTTTELNNGVGKNGSIGTGGNNKSLIAGRTAGGLIEFTGDGGSIGGDGYGGDGDGSAIALIPGGTGGNSSSLQPGRGAGRPGSSFGNGSSTGGDGYGGDGDGSAIALIPGGSGGGSRSSLSGTGGTGGNGSSLQPGRGDRPGSSFGNGSSTGGDGYGGDGDGSAIALIPGGSGGGSRSSLTSTGGGSSKGFGSGLECLTNCQPSYLQEVEYEAIVAVNVKLNDSGQVVTTKLFTPSRNKDLNNFAQTEFGKMQFRLPANVTRRSFLVKMKFSGNR